MRTRPPTRRARPTVARALVGGLATALASALVLGACSPGTDDGPGASDAPTTASPGVPGGGDDAGAGNGLRGATNVLNDARSVREAGTAVTSGALSLAVRDDLSGEPAVVDAVEADGAVTFTVPVPPAMIDDIDVVSIAAPLGTSFDVQGDDSVTVLDGSGAIVGGLGAPSATSDDDTPRSARFTDLSTDVLTLVVTGPGRDGATSAAGTATVSFATSMIESATWGENEGGRSLAVDPTPWARSGGLAAQAGIWAAVVAAVPDADTPGMRDQLLCHAFGAPDKETWNLEPWRPEVDGMTMLASRCNPT